jgi:hypothetical protein
MSSLASNHNFNSNNNNNGYSNFINSSSSSISSLLKQKSLNSNNNNNNGLMANSNNLLQSFLNNQNSLPPTEIIGDIMYGTIAIPSKKDCMIVSLNFFTFISDHLSLFVFLRMVSWV